MAKHIKVTGANSNPVYIPSENILKVVATPTGPGGDLVQIYYIGGGEVRGSIVMADAAAARAQEASINASWLECINAGPDAAGVVVNTTVFTSVN